MHWFDVLKAVRRIASGDGTLTAQGLAEDSDFSDAYAPEEGEEDRRSYIASAWLAKFARWGYVKKAGTAEGERRWVRKYEITGYGKDRPEPGPPPKWPKKAKR